jgi:hypothetical protein
MATAADSQDAPRSDSVRFAVGLIRKGGSRGGVGRMAQRNNWASHVIWGAIAVVAVLAATVTIALVVSSHRGIQVAMPGKRPAPAERVQAQAPAPKTAPSPSSREHEIARLNDALRALADERDQLAERLESVERTLGGITASVPRSCATRPNPPPDAPPAASTGAIAAIPGDFPALRSGTSRSCSAQSRPCADADSCSSTVGVFRTVARASVGRFTNRIRGRSRERTHHGRVAGAVGEFAQHAWCRARSLASFGEYP